MASSSGRTVGMIAGWFSMSLSTLSSMKGLADSSSFYSSICMSASPLGILLHRWSRRQSLRQQDYVPDTALSPTPVGALSLLGSRGYSASLARRGSPLALGDAAQEICLKLNSEEESQLRRPCAASRSNWCA